MRSASNFISNDENTVRIPNETNLVHRFQAFAFRVDYVYAIYSRIVFYLFFNLQQFLLYLSRLCKSVFLSIQDTKEKLIRFESVKYFECPVPRSSLTLLKNLPRKILVLDLDETLIHSDHDGGIQNALIKPTVPYDFIVQVEVQRYPVRFYVYKRPHVDYFLEIVSRWYELVIFTASMEIYGAAVIDKLDNGRNILSRRYYRQNCTFDSGAYSKDLSVVHPDLSRVFILDNSPTAYRFHPWNAIPIKSWFFDPNDACLLSLLPFLDSLRFCRDVRSVLGLNLHRDGCLMITTSNSLVTQVLPTTNSVVNQVLATSNSD